MIRSGKFQLYIISAGYGVVHALEPIHDYDAVMNGGTAHIWQDNQLSSILQEIMLTEKPTHQDWRSYVLILNSAMKKSSVFMANVGISKFFSKSVNLIWHYKPI
jgi:hypothetical protein